MATTQRSNIEVFFRVLGADTVRRAMQRVSQASVATTRQLGNFGAGIGRSLDFAGQKAIQLSRTLALVGAVGLGALAKGLSDINDSSSELTSNVLALRAVNNEIKKASGAPNFAPTSSGFLRDTNSGNRRRGETKQTIRDLEFLQQVAFRSGNSVKELSKNFVQFKASANAVKVPTKDIERLFSGITDASVVLGTSTEQTSRAFLALTQIASKGCHAPGTLILMSDHSTKLVEEIVVGDHLMGPDGNPRRVLRLAHGTQDMFRVIPSDESFHPFVVNLDHKLRLSTGLYRFEFTIEMSAYRLLPQAVRDELFLINRHNIDEHVPFSVEPLGVGEFYGFEIEGDHLYLDAQGFEHHNTVQAEELRGQLSEALPGAIPLAAEAYGMSIRKFMDAVKNGEIESTSFIKKFGAALNSEYKSAANQAANTTRIAMGRLANAFFLAKVDIGNGELDAEFRRIINTATWLLKLLLTSGAFARFGQNLAAALRPLGDRFERAVSGGYNFERVLDALVRGTRILLDLFVGFVVVVGRAFDALSDLKAVFDSYGIRLPSFSEAVTGAADAFLKLTGVLVSRNYSGNGFIDFFASVYFLIEQIVMALARLLNPKVGPGIQSLEEAFVRVARFINQAALAVQAISTGQISPELDEEGQGILVWLALAIDRARTLKASIEEAYALLSGQAAPQDTDLPTQRRFATRDALGDLFAGRDNVSRVNEQGQTLYNAEDLEILFKVREIVERMINFIWENRAAFAAIFDGAVDAVNLIVDAFDGLSQLLDPVAQALGFESLGVAVGYAFGFFLVFGRIYKIIKLAVKEIATLAKAFKSVVGFVKNLRTTFIPFVKSAATALGKFVAIAAAVGLTVFLIAKVGNNWELLADEFGNIVEVVKAGLLTVVAQIARVIGEVFGNLPDWLGGSTVKAGAFKVADDLDERAIKMAQDAAKRSADATAARAARNGGVDPFAKAGPNGFDAFSFISDAGLAKLVGDFGTSQDKAIDKLGEVADNLEDPPEVIIPKDNFNVDSEIAGLKSEIEKLNTTMTGIGRQSAAGLSGLDAETLREQAALAAGGRGPAADFSRPVVIYLQDGSQVELRGKPNDPTIERLAAKTARNRAGQTPAWAE